MQFVCLFYRFNPFTILNFGAMEFLTSIISVDGWQYYAFQILYMGFFQNSVAQARLTNSSSVPHSGAVHPESSSTGHPSVLANFDPHLHPSDANHNRRQCSCCQESHSPANSIDMDRIKNFCENLPENLPMVKALAADPSIGKRPASLAARPEIEFLNSHPPPFRPGVRPTSWHELKAPQDYGMGPMEFDLPPPPPYNPRNKQPLRVT